MTTYPLPTLAFQISPQGVTAPPYSDIFQSLQATMQGIYGTDVYIPADSQDGQMLAVFAKAYSDANNSGIAVYNSFSPKTAIGAGLANNVKINGLKPQVPSKSSANITIVGQAGTIIPNGILTDDQENQWFLPPGIVIPLSGTIIETATAGVVGDITAGPGTISTISTPTRGWQSATNVAAAVPGAPVESDAALRNRQSVSTSLPARTILAAIKAQIANIPGVQQVRLFENDLDTPDGNGLPGHSIAAVVNGGDAVAIATAIERTKAPGTRTYGTTSELIIDPAGVPITIRFFVPTQKTIKVHVTVTPLTGYTSAIGMEIQASIAGYINSLGIYANNGLISNSALIAAAYMTSLPTSYNVTALTAAVDPAGLSTADLAIAFNEIPICSATADVTLTA